MNVRMSNGQPSYSHVVTVSGAGKIVYIAGQLGLKPDGSVAGDFRAQVTQAFENLKSALALVDVRVLDHFVVTSTQAVSMAELGLL